MEPAIIWTAVGVVAVILLSLTPSVREAVGRLRNRQPTATPDRGNYHSRMDAVRELHDHLEGDSKGQQTLESLLPQIVKDEPKIEG